jgi:hypothetical protein
MRAKWLIRIAFLAVTLASGVADADGDRATTEATPPAPSAQAPGEPSAILSIRARALGLAPYPVTPVELEPVKAPTGAGTTRMPSATTEVARGVYLTVMPACIPGVDEPLLPPVSRRAGPPARRR